jgi:hypothetical protein
MNSPTRHARRYNEPATSGRDPILDEIAAATASAYAYESDLRPASVHRAVWDLRIRRVAAPKTCRGYARER